jgi:hypothetical protein
LPAAANLKSSDADLAAVKTSIAESLRAAPVYDAPYRHWAPTRMFPEAVVDSLIGLPFTAQDVHGVSGKRELHNDTRSYFEKDTIARHPVCDVVARAFQHEDTVRTIAAVTGADLDGSYLRIEYAVDAAGFWLHPHTDLGVKRLTLLYYLATDGQEDLGTDVYAAADRWAKRAPFRRNEALMFVPSDNTWHGFEPRPIEGARKSVIINYVTDAWRERWQLAYPDRPVRSPSIARTA